MTYRKNRKYSPGFNRDFHFYLKNRNLLNFSPKGYPLPEYARNGVTEKEAFFLYESNGKLIPTKHPRLFVALVITKASVNFHIKQWGEGLAEGALTWWEFVRYAEKLEAPSWLTDAVKRTRYAKIASIDNVITT